jgi:hypothetical protein
MAATSPNRSSPWGTVLVFAWLLASIASPFVFSLAMQWLYLGPRCAEHCGARRTSLLTVVATHKSGTPEAGCICRDGTHVAWSAPDTVSVASGGVLLAFYLLPGLFFGARALLRRS